MKTNEMEKRILIFALIVVIVLTMQGTRVFAESLQPGSRSETLAEQPDNQSEITEEGSVSGNDLSELQSENQPVVAAEQTYPELTNAILNKCIVRDTTNPPGVTVNLFDYWQSGGSSPYMEIAHDQAWYDDNDNNNPFIEFFTYKMGISEGHLLRFGYTCVGCDYCTNKNYGAWNDSITGRPCQGIVKNKLGAFGFPVLNLDPKSDNEFGEYNNLDENEKNEYLSDEKKIENLSYLFSPSDRSASAYREMYIDIQGLFQTDEDGYYYYNSTENFAFYDKKTNSFILYNSPGVAEESTNEDSRGQFFPFNKAEDVFDTYTTDANGKYHLCYVDKKNDSNGDPKSYDYPIAINGNSYLQCSADRLNHYLGMTLEFSFQQPENGYFSDGKPMTFEFSGDDDVWIFIDGVLVADLGGLHDSISLKIDFSTGEVNVAGEPQPHTLLDSFKDAYVEDSNLGGIEFRGNTFADNTDHTFKMFYLERGHGASDLALKFNVLTIPDEPVTEEPPNEEPDEPVNEEPPNEEHDENEEPAPDIISVSDNHMVLDTTEIPRTGDDFRIGWLSALCIISLLGIGATVYNLFFVRRKQKNHSSKQ